MQNDIFIIRYRNTELSRETQNLIFSTRHLHLKTLPFQKKKKSPTVCEGPFSTAFRQNA